MQTQSLESMPRDSISENIDGNARDLLEEIGVDTDESVDISLSTMQQLLPKRMKC